MNVAQVILGSFFAAITIALGIYTFFAARGKGPILSNSYLFLSKEERAKVDKKAEYKLVSVVFGGLTGVFLLLTVQIFTGWKFLRIPMWLLVLFLLVYAIADAIKTEMQKNK